MGIRDRRDREEGREWETPPERTGPGTHRVTLVGFLGLLACFLAATIGMIQPYLLALSTGGVLALLAYPLYVKLRTRGWGAKTASTITTIGVLIVVVGPISLFLMRVIEQGVAIGQALSGGSEFSLKSLLDRVAHLRFVEALTGDPVAFERQIRQGIQGLAKSGTSLILAVAGSVPNVLLQLALALISCFFLLIDGRRFLDWIAGKIPLDSDVRGTLVASFKDTTLSVIWASLAAAGAQASVILVSFLLLGVPAAFLAAGATFIFAWIPMVGSAPVWLAGALALYLQGAVGRCIAMIGFGLFTGIVDNLVRPWVLKGRSSMHPLVALVAIFGGIRMFGIMGVLLGPVLIAATTTLLQTWPIVGRRFGILDLSERARPAERLRPGVSGPSPGRE